ncbi:DUF1064 domain-containing protein [Bacillus cereus]|nr:DUF1064 domain-containing protein [Bacillus cereus]
MSKYNNKKVKLDSHVFDSKSESDYYMGLKARKAAGEILSFELKLRFNLQPAFIKNTKKYQAITYKEDFMVYLPNGDMEVVDIKGMAMETFTVNRKMLEYKSPHLQLIYYKCKERFLRRPMTKLILKKNTT